MVPRLRRPVAALRARASVAGRVAAGRRRWPGLALTAAAAEIAVAVHPSRPLDLRCAAAAAGPHRSATGRTAGAAAPRAGAAAGAACRRLPLRNRAVPWSPQPRRRRPQPRNSRRPRPLLHSFQECLHHPMGA